MRSGESAPHHVVESFSVHGGFLDGARFELEDGLASLIGGRGSGKSTALTMLTFVLGGAPIVPARVAAFDERVRAQLGEGQVVARVRTRHGVRYEVSRRVGEPPRVRDERGALRDVALDHELFSIDVYAQGEIEEVGRTPAAMRALLDRFLVRDLARVAEGERAVLRALSRTAADLARLAAEIDDADARLVELPVAEEALRGVALAGDDGEVAAAHEAKAGRTGEELLAEQARRETTAVRTALVAFAEEAARRLAAARAAAPTGPNRALVASMHDDVARAAAAVEDLAARAQDALDAALSALDAKARTLAAAHVEQDEAYHATLARRAADVAAAADRDRLQRRFLELSLLSARAAELRVERDARKAERARLLGELFALRQERTALREACGERLTRALEDEVRISILGDADHAAYLALVKELLHGANVRPAELVEAIAARIRPEDLAAQAEADDPEAIMAVDESKTGKRDRALRVLAALRASGRLAELETVPLEDVPVFALRTGEGRWEPTTVLSDGQRCACVFSVLLRHEASVLVVDQPEDNLGNACITSFILQSIARAKERRQLVFATHNANIAILGDSARVFAMAAHDGHGKIAHHGSIDEMRTVMEELLDGGPEAFLTRSRRYGHGG